MQRGAGGRGVQLEALEEMRLQPGIRPYATDADREIPMASAISAWLRCVALRGVSGTVLAIALRA